MAVNRIVLLFYTVLLTISWTDNTNEDFFLRYYQIINYNIQQERYEANLELIGKLVQQPAYQELDCYRKGKILHKIGVSYYSLLRDSEAIAYYRNVIFDVWENCPRVPPSERANTIYNMGMSYHYINDWESAKSYIDEALYIIENDVKYPRLDLADKYYGVGNFYHKLNDAFRSELYYRKAIGLYQEFEGTEAWRFEVLNELIAMSLNFKDYENTKKYIDKALSIYKFFPDTIDQLNLAWVYLNAGTTHLELKEYTTARQMAKKALELLSEEADPFYYSIALELVAMIQLEEGELIGAEKNMYRVLNIRKTLYLNGESQHEIALAYENLCDILIKKGTLGRADHHLGQAFEMLLPEDTFDSNYLPIIRKSKARDDEQLIRLIELKTKIFEARYQNSGNVTFLNASLNAQHKIDSIIKRGLLSFQFQQSKLDFFEIRIDHYGKAIKDALQLYKLTNDKFYLEEAYQFSSKTKALILQQELNKVNALETSTTKDIVEEEQSLRKNMNDQQALLFEATESTKDSLLQEYLVSQNKLDAFLQRIEQNKPEYYNERYKFLEVPTVEKIQHQIPKDLAVVEFFVSDKAMYSFWITKDGFFSQTSPFHKDFKTAVTAFVDQCNSPLNPITESLSTQIFKQTLQEGLNKIGKKVQRLCIIPDGPLHSISFEALSYGDTYLIEDYAISYAYAAALLDQGKSTDAENQMEYVGFGTEYSELLNQKLRSKKRFFGDEILGQLTMSKQEIEQAAAIFQGTTFINEQATLDNFSKHANKARIVHLSLHGLVDFNDPHRSCIIFDDSREEYLLSPQDLYQNRLKAELVLLSACHSASGKIYQGEGVQGMSRAFLLGGARNILSSLWNASEASSLQITTSFLENIKDGYSTDRALRQGKLDYLKTATPSQKHPYYWANFIILGEVDATSPNSEFPYVWILLLITTLFLLGYGFLRKRLNTK